MLAELRGRINSPYTPLNKTKISSGSSYTLRSPWHGGRNKEEVSNLRRIA
jgi:hypothetical protein